MCINRENVEVDVVIPTFGRPARVSKTLRALLQQAPSPMRVIVINQTPGVSGPDCDIRQIYQNHRVELCWLNRSEPSLCGARNDALHVAKSPILLFLDDDVLLPNDLVGQHWRKYQVASEELGALGGQVWHRQQHAVISQLSIENPEKGTSKAYSSETSVLHGPLFGCHFSIRREVAIALGGWDESFIGSANWEEGDLMNRLMGRSVKFYWHPDLWLIHIKEPIGGCRIPGNESFPEWTKSSNFFLYKYRYYQDKSWPNVLWSALRSGPLRKEIVLDPSKWPAAWAGFIYGWFEGRRRAFTPQLMKN